MGLPPVPPSPAIKLASSPPDETDVVVVGAGIIGVSTALFLAESGLRVTICEKDGIACEQSSRNWGWVRQLGRDQAEYPLAGESLKIWRSFRQNHNIDTGYRESGIAYLYREDREFEQARTRATAGLAHGLELRVLQGDRIADILPGIRSGFKAALYSPTDGRAEPAIATHAILKAACNLGTRVAGRCAVRGIETRAGRISAVVTEQSRICCSAVVVAAGAWSRRFLGNLGIDFPQLTILSTAARVEGVNKAPGTAVGCDGFAFRKRLDGGYTIALRNTNIVPIVPDSFRLFGRFQPAYRRNIRTLKLRIDRSFIKELTMPRRWSNDSITPFETHRQLDPLPLVRLNQMALDGMKQVFPAFDNARLTHSWAGMIDATPDELPVIDRIGSCPGLYLASGFSGHGFGIGPGAGRLMAQIVTGETTVVDPAPFRFDRDYTRRDGIVS